eukprot:PhM_4_TR10963/c0_g1_i2/m.85507
MSRASRSTSRAGPDRGQINLKKPFTVHKTSATATQREAGDVPPFIPEAIKTALKCFPPFDALPTSDEGSHTSTVPEVAPWCPSSIASKGGASKRAREPDVLPDHYVMTNNVDLETYFALLPENVRSRVIECLKGTGEGYRASGRHCGVCGDHCPSNAPNRVVQCTSCHTCAHLSCLLSPLRAEAKRRWVCGLCSVVGSPTARKSVICSLCHRTCGDDPTLLMYPTNADATQFCHIVCARMTPNVRVLHGGARVDIRGVTDAQRSLECYVCGKGGAVAGSCSQCLFYYCSASLHPSCAVANALQCVRPRGRSTSERSESPVTAGSNALTWGFYCRRHFSSHAELDHLLSDIEEPSDEDADDDDDVAENPNLPESVRRVLQHYRDTADSSAGYYAHCPELATPGIVRGRALKLQLEDPVLQTVIAHRVLPPPLESVTLTRHSNPAAHGATTTRRKGNTLKVLSSVRELEPSMQQLCVLSDITRRRSKLKRQLTRLAIEEDRLLYNL